ncbi:serine protease [Actinoplanes sp. NPDC026619]|uniref:S1 family peptidase n=1 Tax=Actinoplanes sp. NPDC026619 TaxID=3155798 RepID=UPI00340A746C
MSNTARLRRLAALAAVFTVALATPAPAHAADGGYGRNESITSLVNPSTLVLVATFTGTLRERAGGDPIDDEPVVLRRTCSGMVINPAGYVVSTSQCVRPSSDVLLANALTVESQIQVVRGEMAVEQAADYVTTRMKTAEFTGADREKPPVSTVEAWIDSYHERDDDARAITGSVVYAQPMSGGDVAVVKLNKAGLPAVELAREDTLATGDPIVLSGYYSDGQQPNELFSLRNVSTTVGGLGGTNRLTISDGIGPQARGGAISDSTGRLLAIQDADVSATGEPVRDIVKASHIQRALASAKVTASLSDADREYRSALQDYFAGRFTQAADRFGALAGRAPNFWPAKLYRDRAIERRDVDGDAIVNAAQWGSYALAVGAGVLILGLLHLAGRWRRPATAAPTTDPPAVRTWPAADAPEQAPRPAPAPALRPEPRSRPESAPVQRPEQPPAFRPNQPARMADPADAETVVMNVPPPREPMDDETAILELDRSHFGRDFGR